MTALGSIAEEVATLEEERDRLLEAVADLVVQLQKTPHRPHDGSEDCLRCRADRLTEEFSL